MRITLAELELHRVIASESYAPGSLDFHGAEFRQTAPLHVKATAELQGAEIRIRGNLATRLEASCDRCLAPVEVPVSRDFDLFYRPIKSIAKEEDIEIPPDEMEVGFYSGDGIELADVAVVLDPSLLAVVNIVDSVRDHGLIIINTAGKTGITGMKNGLKVATVDAVSIALKYHLIKEGSPMVNTPLLGAFAAATDLITIESLEKGLKWKMSGLAATNNIAALRAAFEATCKLN